MLVQQVQLEICLEQRVALVAWLLVYMLVVVVDRVVGHRQRIAQAPVALFRQDDRDQEAAAP